MFAAIMIAIGRTRDGAFQQTAVEDENGSPSFSEIGEGL
jgi:hypothetical protein